VHQGMRYSTNVVHRCSAVTLSADLFAARTLPMAVVHQEALVAGIPVCTVTTFSAIQTHSSFTGCRSGSRCENGACIDPAPGPTQVDIVDTFRKLLRCAPCGKGSCSFTQVGNTSDVTFSLAVGRPVMNCGNATSSIKSAVEELITIGEAWSVDGGLGFGLRGLNLLELQGSHTNSRTISWSQSVEIEVKPGEMGVMTATVRYRQATGSLKIDSDQPYAVIANQPVEFMSYGSEVVPCTTLFSGNVSSAFNCTSTDSARMWLNGHALSTSLLFPLFIVLSLVLDM